MVSRHRSVSRYGYLELGLAGAVGLVVVGLCVVHVSGQVSPDAGRPDAASPEDAGTSPPGREVGWIWSHAGAEKRADKGVVHFRLDVDLDARPERAEIMVSGDNVYTLWVNGIQAIHSNNWQKPISRHVAGAMRAGRNILAIDVSNPKEGPAGLYVIGFVETGADRIDLTGSAQWRWSNEASEDWRTAPAASSEWSPAVVLGGFDMKPWSLGTEPALKRRWAPITPGTDWESWRARVRRELAALETPADPPGDPAAHPIDRFMEAWWADANVTPPETCDDRTFVRRVYLDAWGLLPTETEVENFVGDARPGKRARLIEELLVDDDRYAEGWMAWWCDLLRNDEQTNIDDLRKPVTGWLFEALRTNRPYDEMVGHLLNPGPGGPDGYLKGINWRGRVNSSQQPAMQAAQNVGQVFLGTNIKCVSCHDHFTKPYMLDDSYSLASLFSETNLEIHRCDQPTGHKAIPSFVFADLSDLPYGEVPYDADYTTRLESVSRMVTTPHNPRFARTMVNRLWRRLMGRGLIEPVDDYAAEPANAELLEWLAHDFMQHDYDVKHTLRLLMTSKAYALRSIAESSDEKRASDSESPLYVGPPPRRMSSEQFYDGICRLTGYWPEVSTMNVRVDNARIRAWRHRIPDPLMLALGRPSREQVTTVREEDPSMLQMLEMVNGRTLADLMDEGAAVLLASPLGEVADPGRVLEVLFLRAYARPPTDQEHALLEPLVGHPEDDVQQRRADWADLCWMLVMSPEFQYIR